MSIEDSKYKRNFPIEYGEYQSSPKASQEYAPRTESSVLVEVENIPQLWEEEQLLGFFAARAQVSEATIERDPDTDWSLGKGSIRFNSLEEALRIIGELSGKELIQGAPKAVQLFIPNEECRRLGIPEMDTKENCKVSLSNLPKSLTEGEIAMACGRFGKIESIDLQRDAPGPYNTCTMVYTSPEAAAEAKANLGVIYQQLAPPYAGYPAPVTEAGYYSHSILSPATGHPPLQQIFFEYTTPEGIQYYYNAYTKLTQWEHPPTNCYIIPNPNKKIEPRQVYTTPGPPSSPFGKDTRPFRPPHGGVFI